MTEKPLVSVIINCYNSEKYIREAIDSVIAQTYRNWEIVFWDNQSTDSTQSIVESYCNPQIRYFYAPSHTTLGEARNLALEKVEGDYLCFLDGDDYWADNFISDIMAIMAKDPEIGLCYPRYWKFTDSEKWPVIGGNKSGIVPIHDLIMKYNIGMSGAIFKTELIMDNNIRFDNQFSLIEDFDFFLRIAVFCKVYYVSECLMYYRIHDSNTSKSDKWVDEFQIMLNHIEDSPNYSGLKKHKRAIENLKNHYQIQEFLRNGEKSKAIKLLVKRSPYDISSLRYLAGIIFGLDFYANIRRNIVKIKAGLKE